MTGHVFFDNTARRWNVRNGQFDIVLGIAYELYMPRAKDGELAAELKDNVGPWLHDWRPDRYPEPAGMGLRVLVFDKFPIDERKQLLAAVELVLRDFEEDLVDPTVVWTRERRDEFIDVSRTLVALMKQSLAQPDVPHSEAKT
jgi:hypothetical protein